MWASQYKQWENTVIYVHIVASWLLWIYLLLLFLLIILENNCASHFEFVYQRMYDSPIFFIHLVEWFLSHISMSSSLVNHLGLFTYLLSFHIKFHKKIGLRMSNYNDKKITDTMIHHTITIRVIILVKKSPAEDD